MRQPRIVVLGQVCIDHNTIEGLEHTSWGSPVMHMSMYFKRIVGISPTIITPYGPDFLPYAQGIALYPSKPSTSKTLVYENVVSNGHRVQYCHYADSALPTDIDASMSLILKSADILCVAPLTPAYSFNYLQDIMAAVPESCVKVLLPQGYLRNIQADGLVGKRAFVEAVDIIPLFDVVILSDEDLDDAVAVVQHWKQLSTKTDFVMTQNEHGASITQEDKMIQIPTEPVTGKQIKNPIGLGDVFGAATAYQLYLTHDLTRAVAKGNTAARQSLVQPLPKEK